MPIVSVIVPIYNVEKYLQKCIDSIKAQTISDFECILVNDCSPDKCEAICKKTCAEDSRFKYIKRKTNGGLGATRNSGLDKATGKYISFIDSDDTIAPTFYEELIPLAEKYGWVRSGLRVVNEAGKETKKYKVDEQLCRKDDPEIKVLNNKYNLDLSTVCSCVFKADVIDGLRFDTCKYGEDYIFSLTLFNTFGQVYFCDKYLYNYLIRNDSLSGSKTVDKFRLISFLNSFTKMLRSVKDTKLKQHYINNFENRYYLKDLCHNGIDFVIPYVDNSDEAWLKEFNAYATKRDTNDAEVAGKSRFRTNGYFKYLFRGIETCLPWINKIHLVVSSESQIPDWLDRDKVHIVLHEDIIPEELLPTFNCSTIEMFYQNIVGLSDRFLYGNDDVFILNKCEPETFFNGQFPKIEMMKVKHADGQEVWRKTFINSYKLASGKTQLDGYYMAPEHGLTPYTKDVLVNFTKKHYSDIYNSCTRFREAKNLNIYMLADYLYENNLIDKTCINFGYTNNDDSVEKITKFFNKSDVLCINDTAKEIDEEKANQIKKLFSTRFPSRSYYELGNHTSKTVVEALSKLPEKVVLNNERQILQKEPEEIKRTEKTENSWYNPNCYLYF